MIDRHLTIIKNLFTGPSQPETEIDFLHVGEKNLVKSTGLMKISRPNKKTGARSPINGDLVIILMLILLRMVKNPPPAIGVTKPIQETAPRTRMVKITG